MAKRTVEDWPEALGPCEVKYGTWDWCIAGKVWRWNERGACGPALPGFGVKMLVTFDTLEEAVAFSTGYEMGRDSTG